jgi:hypothetical protein
VLCRDETCIATNLTAAEPDAPAGRSPLPASCALTLFEALCMAKLRNSETLDGFAAPGTGTSVHLGLHLPPTCGTMAAGSHRFEEIPEYRPHNTPVAAAAWMIDVTDQKTHSELPSMLQCLQKCSW